MSEAELIEREVWARQLAQEARHIMRFVGSEPQGPASLDCQRAALQNLRTCIQEVLTRFPDADSQNKADLAAKHPVDAWIDAIPDDNYAPCPCGCGMKLRYAEKDGIEKHEQRFIDKHIAEQEARR